MADGGHQLAILMAYIKQVPSYSFTAFIYFSILYFLYLYHRPKEIT